MSGQASQAFIPAMKAKLPPMEALLPYMQKIYESEKFCNFGPLETVFRERLADELAVMPENIVTFCNGTVALACSLALLNLPRGSLCAMPAWTFTATAAAALQAGLTPYFIDVDQTSWSLPHAALEAAFANAPGPIGCVIPVSPFGEPVDVVAWDAFKKRHNIPVVIDAAGAYDSLHEIASFTPGDIPIMVSLHGTKPLGIGEGGMVICKDADFTQRLKAMTVFGFKGNRDSAFSATNAKISEYTAAVGLAALDTYPAFRQRYVILRDRYAELLDSLHIAHRLHPEFISVICNIVVPGKLTEYEAAFSAAGIETRRWWEGGCHRHTAYRKLPRTDLPVTDRLADSVLGIPFFHDMTDSQFQRVANVLSAAVVEAKHALRAHA